VQRPELIKRKRRWQLRRGKAAMFDFSASSLFASLIWGAIGSGLFIYGKKQKSWVPLGCGLAMVAVSYFVDSAWGMSLASTGILGIMYWLKKQGY
jgi:hypothetical protein